MAAAVQTTAEGLKVATPRAFIPPSPRAGRFQSFDVTADGQRFLIDPVCGTGAAAADGGFELAGCPAEVIRDLELRDN